MQVLKQTTSWVSLWFRALSARLAAWRPFSCRGTLSRRHTYCCLETHRRMQACSVTVHLFVCLTSISKLQKCLSLCGPEGHLYMVWRYVWGTKGSWIHLSFKSSKNVVSFAVLKVRLSVVLTWFCPGAGLSRHSSRWPVGLARGRLCYKYSAPP